MNSQIMVCGDWHGDTEWAVKMVKRTAQLGLDRIIQVGDFGLWDHTLGGMKYLDIMNEACRKHGVKIYWLDGNHENHDHLAIYKKINPKNNSGQVYLRSHVIYSPRGCWWEWHGKKFMTVGGAVSIDRGHRVQGESFWEGEELSEREVKGINQKVDYLFTHDCPSNAPFKYRLKPDYDSVTHRQRMNEVGKITQPKVWFHGHMHEKYVYNFMHQSGYADVYGLQMNGDTFSWGVLDIPSGKFAWAPSGGLDNAFSKV